MGRKRKLLPYPERPRVRDIAFHRVDTGVVFDPQMLGPILQAVYDATGNLLGACRALGLPYAVAKRWRRDEPAFAEGLAYVDELLNEEGHEVFMQHVLDPANKYPAYPIFHKKATDPRYAEKAKSVAVTVSVQGTMGRSESQAIPVAIVKELTS